MASVECNIKFRLSLLFSFKAWKGLEAQISLVIELVCSAATNGLGQGWRSREFIYNESKKTVAQKNSIYKLTLQ